MFQFKGRIKRKFASEIFCPNASPTTTSTKAWSSILVRQQTWNTLTKPMCRHRYLQGARPVAEALSEQIANWKIYLACDGVQSAEGTWTHTSRGRRWKEGNKRSSKADSGNHSSLWRQHGKVFCSRHAPLLDGHPCNQPLEKPEFAKSLQNQPVILHSSIFPPSSTRFKRPLTINVLFRIVLW